MLISYMTSNINLEIESEKKICKREMNRGIHAFSYVMGNQGKKAGNVKFVLEI